MYALLSTDRDELNLTCSLYRLKEHAQKVMLQEVLDVTDYTEDEVKTFTEPLEEYFGDEQAYMQTSAYGTVVWEIHEVVKPYILVSVDEEQLEFVVQQFAQFSEASGKMFQEIQEETGCTLDTLVELSNSGDAYVSDDECWAFFGSDQVVWHVYVISAMQKY